MKTKIYKINEEEIEEDIMEEGARLIRGGELVAFPTETVYGLGANGLDEEAVRKIFKAKGRPSDNPLILHISSQDELEDLVAELPQSAGLVMDKFWPGPLTLIFKKSDIIPDIITAGLDTVAIRMPDNKIARRLIELSGRPIAAPSANRSGKPSPTKAEHVALDLDGSLEMIIDGGSTGIGLESTVLDLTEEEPMILRPGGVSYEDLKPLLPNLRLDPSLLDLSEKIRPKSPGQKYRHYAPESEMLVYEGSLEDMEKAISSRARQELEMGRKVGILATDQTRESYKEGLVYSMGSREDFETIAYNFFHLLRLMDEEEVDIILAESIGYSEIGLAVMNRMLKASGGAVEKV